MLGEIELDSQLISTLRFQWGILGTFARIPNWHRSRRKKGIQIFNLVSQTLTLNCLPVPLAGIDKFHSRISGHHGIAPRGH